MEEEIYKLVTQGVLSKEQADIVCDIISEYNKQGEEIAISLSECL